MDSALVFGMFFFFVFFFLDVTRCSVCDIRKAHGSPVHSDRHRLQRARPAHHQPVHRQGLQGLGHPHAHLSTGVHAPRP